MKLLLDIAILVWLAWLCWGGGRVALRTCGLAADGIAGLWLSTTAGLAGLSLLVFVLGVFHVFTVHVVLACLGCVSLAVAGAMLIDRHRQAGQRAGLWAACRRSIVLAGEAPFAAAIVVAGAVIAFGGACTPEVRGDPIIYHIAEANLFVVNRGHTEIRSSALTYIPQHQHLLYALGLLLGDDSLAKMFHWLAGLLLLAGCSSVVLLVGGSVRDAIRAATLLMLFPMWLYLATTTYIDLAAGNYILAGLYCILASGAIDGCALKARWGIAGWALLSGVFFGSAMATKYTAAVVGTLPAAAVGAAGLSGGLRSGRVSPKTIGLAAGAFALGSLILFGPWLVRNYTWTGNPVAPSLMRWLGPAAVPEATLTWPDIQAGNPAERWPPARLIATYARMLMALGDYGNYLPPIVLVLGLAGLAGGTGMRRAFFPPPVVAMLLFCAMAFLFGVPTGAVRRDSRYVMAHAGIMAVLVAFWYARVAMLFAGREKLLRRLGGLVMALLLFSFCVRSYLSFSDLRETVIPLVTDGSRKSFLRARLQKYEANMALGQAMRGRQQGKVLGAQYPAAVDYVLGGMPLTEDLMVQRTDAITSDRLAALRRQGVRYLFGSVSDELAAGLEPMGQVKGVPLHRIP